MQKLLKLFLLSAVLVCAACAYSYYLLNQPLKNTGQTIDVLYGDSVYRMADKLKQQHIFDYPLMFVAYARLTKQVEIKAGEYQLSDKSSAIGLLKQMIAGDVTHYQVTFIEGSTSQEAINALQKSYGIVSTIDADNEAQVLQAIGADKRFKDSEGLLFPETYQYIKGSTDKEVLKRAYQALLPVLDAAWQEAQKKKLPYASAYQLLIMASIIEKETSVAAEREQIAGVFVERLKKHMRLQTDPTVIYGMGAAYQGKIGYRDLRTDTPYNTYTRSGLPPTPIGLASRASINAAANPLLNGKLYFVAKGNGYHYFSSSLQEHNRAVREYQKNRSQDYHSTPKQEK